MGGRVNGTPEAIAAQSRLVLTSHVLQRIGAWALTALSGDNASPDELSPQGFTRAMALVAEHAEQASIRDSKAADGFWQKTSLSFFPNSVMNHPSRRKGENKDGRPKTDQDVRETVRLWLRMPDPATWPSADCVLCGRRSVGFFGKRDVAMAESEAYRNTTPRGHDGMALCWPCLSCFYALPYGCRLTGGSSTALHTWDEGFLRRTVPRQVGRSVQLAVTGDAAKKQTEPLEVAALRGLRAYGERLTDGVELLVFNNNNRGQLLAGHSVQQPLAEWLRLTCRLPERRRSFTALVRAHAGEGTPGLVGLARNAFRAPPAIVTSGARYLAAAMAGPPTCRGEAAEFAELLFSFATEVMQVNEKDLSEIRATGHKIAALLAENIGRGGLKEFRAKLRNSRQLRSWVTSRAVAWAGRPQEGVVGPLVSERAFVLLFDPGQDNPSWFHRDLLLIGVLEHLSRLGWHAKDGQEPAEVITELDDSDRDFIGNDDEDDQ